ncbi:hypothetical protein J6590_012491 [Homalodisca vitripennis]|nr:hypothetical protein J6590_012491 [Homalodisca vitripennis]
MAKSRIKSGETPQLKLTCTGHRGVADPDTRSALVTASPPFTPVTLAGCHNTLCGKGRVTHSWEDEDTSASSTDYQCGPDPGNLQGGNPRRDTP